MNYQDLKMRLLGWRKLQVTPSGKGYLVFTVILGVVAMSSGNNVIYLIESFLLGGLILSGVLSELAITAVSLEYIRAPATAGAPSLDRIFIKNKKPLSLYCVEVGEWKDQNFVPSAFIPLLKPHEEKELHSNTVYPKRGLTHIEGLAIATQFPFGFAKKIRILPTKESRLIWPEKMRPSALSLNLSSDSTKDPLQSHSIETSIRNYEWSDDLKDVIWLKSQKTPETWVVRGRTPNSKKRVIELDIGHLTSDRIEEEIKKAASYFYYPDSEEESPILVLKEDTQVRRFNTRWSALNQLSLIEARK